MKVTDIIRNLHTLSLDDLILLSQAVDDTISEVTDEMAQYFEELIKGCENVYSN